MKRKVVISGLGLTSALGHCKEDFGGNLFAGKYGGSEISSFDTSKHRTKIAGEIKGFNKHPFYASYKTHDRTINLALACIKQAIKDAATEDYINAGLILGTTMGNIDSFIDLFTPYLKESKFNLTDLKSLKTFYLHKLTAFPTQEFSLQGYSGVLPTVCASGTHALCLATLLIQSGKQDMMLAGGSDALNEVIFAGFNALRSVTPEVCSPFSIGREGLLPAEGAGILVLEEKERALNRGAHIYAEVEGFGISCDAKHIAMPDPSGEGAALAMKQALATARLNPEQIDYINAHGTGTPLNDTMETLAIKEAFGKAAYQVPISSTKSMIGHTMGAAGALEAIACILSLEANMVPPTINYKGKDPKCDLDYVPNKAREKTLNRVLSNSFGFGGNNASIILRKVKK